MEYWEVIKVADFHLAAGGFPEYRAQEDFGQASGLLLNWIGLEIRPS